MCDRIIPVRGGSRRDLLCFGLFRKRFMDPIISFENYTFQYRQQQEPTLFDINLKVYPGQKILITGPSGCGKSTLAHCINGLIPGSWPGKSTGTLTVDGVDPQKEGVFGMSKHVGTVLQDTDGQFIGLTVAEDLAFALENDGVSQEEMFERVDRVSDIVDMKSFMHHAPTELSGGQKQRVSMGGVLVDNVKILLFDEPLANLDPATGKHTIELIDEICKSQNVTAIIIEHRLEDVLYRNVDRIVVVNDGRIVADETPDDLLCTDTLERMGVREPLYVTAIKHALAEQGMKNDVPGEAGTMGGASKEALEESGEALTKIRPADHPQHIESMNVEPYKAAVQKWFRETYLPQHTNENPYALEVSHLSFSYNMGESVLRDIDFKVRKGEMISIVGKNGAGKSTLSSLICGFNTPLEGRILLNGEDIAPLSIKERGEKIGLVMQSPNQMISKPMISEEVGLGLTVRGVPEEEVTRRVNETLKICGLYQMRNWPVSALSFGQKKRVSIASILVMNPEILILDEPTAGQDYRHYTEIMEFLKRLNEEMGLTIIMITHDMHLMLEYTDRAIVLADGQMITDDTPAHVLTNEKISDRAYLKKTSLYDLAVKCGIQDPGEFADRFISYERQHRLRPSSADAQAEVIRQEKEGRNNG